MSYAAADRMYCDADSHIMETPDWVSKHADPEIRERLRPLDLAKGGKATLEFIERAMNRLNDPGQDRQDRARRDRRSQGLAGIRCVRGQRTQQGAR